MRTAFERLTRRAEFRRLTRARRSSARPGLVLQALRRPDGEGEARVGLTASRRVGNAVRRNRARRRLRALAEKVIPLHAKHGHDYVMIARVGTADRPFSALVEDLETAMKRLNVWRDD
ncbi:MAG: ribonuclease P protein component [Alphaproteobacteria bacterium]|nr:ribonuclease P protein component [Alphaproteobacteria bacterium]